MIFNTCCVRCIFAHLAIVIGKVGEKRVFRFFW